MSVSQVSSLGDQPKVVNRWVQLVAGIVAMMAIANLQYAWTIFTGPLTTSLNSSLAAIQVAFSTFILAETWLVPFEGALVDWLGPRLMIAIGGLLVGVGWVGAGYATTVTQLIIIYTVGGIGAGAVYGGCMGNVLKWFPDHRGLCAGLTAGAYGIGTALTVAPIAKMIKASGYAHTFIFWGIIQGIVVVIAAMTMLKPPAGWAPPGWKEKEAILKSKVRMSAIDMTPFEMIRTGSFWIIYLMMTMMAFSGLVVTAQLAPIAKFYHVDKVVVAFGMTALVLAIEIDRILNGVTRPFWGWVSDHIGRENTMFIAFSLQAITVWCLLQLIHHPVWFIVLSGLCFFSWGEIFSLFPSITGDLFGKKWATTNYGVVYTGKGLASIFAGPVAALASTQTGSWVGVFWAMIVCSALAAVIALIWLKPAAARTIAQASGAAAAAD
ncbi:MAG TPA: oxalate/formate MFS antiporter [Candidatus Acidoferrales bacterium]|nr:oxalate/formate MFS antiporter [Candidatus Acidoferrales bacterium]